MAPLPEQIVSPVVWLTGLNLPIANWFEAVRSDCRQLCESLQAHRDEMLLSLAA